MPLTKKKTFDFKAPLERMRGKYAWHFVEFPYDVEKEFGTRATVRVKATMNGVACDRALMPTKSGYHILILGAALRRAAKVKSPGDIVHVELFRDPSPDEVDIPEELAETLEFIPEFNVFWKSLAPGMQRSMCYWVGSAKTQATRAKRIAELLRRFEEDDWHFGGRRIRTKP